MQHERSLKKQARREKEERIRHKRALRMAQQPQQFDGTTPRGSQRAL
jgi:hypothetical protein